MSEFVVRRLIVDLKTPIARHWNGGNPFRTALFNALSFSFPTGEQFFIDSVRNGVRQLADSASAEQLARWNVELRGFVGQEATHRRIHDLFNDHLLRRGLVNRWALRIVRRSKRLEGCDPRAPVAATAAAEHLTATLSQYLLAHHATALAGAEPRLRDLWLWHSSEELEHRATAFDLYRAMGGTERWRRRLFFVVSFNFVADLCRQTLNNLWQDGSWWWPSTWASAARVVFGRDGLLRNCIGPWRRYLAADFHPSQDDAAAAHRWLAEHAQLAPPVAG